MVSNIMATRTVSTSILTTALSAVVLHPCQHSRRPNAFAFTGSGNEHDYAWADSAYSGETIEAQQSLDGFENLIHEKGARNHPLSDAVKDPNRIKSAIRACVEHVFSSMTMSMGGRLTRKIAPERTEGWWGLKNLAFSFLRFFSPLPMLLPLHEFRGEEPRLFADLRRSFCQIIGAATYVAAF